MERETAAMADIILGLKNTTCKGFGTCYYTNEIRLYGQHTF